MVEGSSQENRMIQKAYVSSNSFKMSGEAGEMAQPLRVQVILPEEYV